MKKNILSLFAIALAIGFSAFTAPVSKDNGNLTTYKWKNLLVNPQVYVANGQEMTQSAAQAAFFPSCTGGPTHCAQAYNSSDVAQSIYIDKTP